MPVRTEIADGVGLITLDRPEKRNALDPASLVALEQAWLELGADESVRAVVLTGAGDAFCAGMDLEKTIPAARALAKGERISDEDFAGLKAVRGACLQGEIPAVPIIAAVNGHCHGQGTDMLLGTDLRIAAPGATFALEEVSLGLFPRGLSAVMLPRQVSWVRAMELLLHVKDDWTASEALEAGLVNAVVERDRLLEVAMSWARRLAGFPRSAVRETVMAARHNLFAALDDAHGFADAAAGRAMREMAESG